MKNWWIIATVVIFFAFTVWGTYYVYQKRVVEPQKITTPPLPSPRETFPSSKESSPSPETFGLSQPATGITTQPDTGVSETENPNIAINNPKEQAIISSPVKISGWARITTGNIIIQIKDAYGKILGQNTKETCANFQVCPFETILTFSNPNTLSGTIEVFEKSTDQPSHFSSVVQFK